MPYFGGRPHLSDLRKYRRGLVSLELLSETEIIFLLETKGQQAASERRAVKEDDARGDRAAGSKGRGGRRLSHLQQVADGPAARRAPAAVR